MTQQSRSQHTSGRSANRILFLLSGEAGLPEAEAHALVLMLDPSAKFSHPEKRVLIAQTSVDPFEIESRVAYSRRVGEVVENGELSRGQLELLRSGSYAIRVIRFGGKKDSSSLVDRLAREVDGRVSLDDPDRELTVVRGDSDYLAITAPRSMGQRWVVRRPRARAFFHPSAIFPKLSRFLVNLTRVRRGEVFVDPFCGTGSLLIEAWEVGALPLGLDLSEKMVRGAARNERKLGQGWLGVVRADARYTPVRSAAGIATDIPYGRVSSTSGSSTREILEELMSRAAEQLAKDGRLVAMHPKTLEVHLRKEFELEEEHHLYIHRKLTRTISVLRRV